MLLMLAAVLAFAGSALACRWLAKHAASLGLLDLPDARKQHAGAVPLVGGLAVLAGFVAACALAGLLPALLSVAGPGLLMLGVGLVDDRHNLRAVPKLLWQILAASWLVWATGAALHSLPLPFMGGHLALGWAAAPLTVLMIVAILNAINMIDGLDGLAGGCLLIASVALGAAAMLSARMPLALLAMLLAAALAGFLLWNARWPWQARARVFLGDGGALAVGMLLCWLILQLSLSWQGSAVLCVPLTVVLAPLAVPVMDLVVVAFWRAVEGRNPMQADRGHSHHLLLEMGLSTVAAVRLMWLAAALIAAATFAAWRLGVTEGHLLGVLLGTLLVYLLWFRMSWLRVRSKNREQRLQQRRGDELAEPPLRILFVTTGLGVGGAERALEQLLPRLSAQGMAVALVSLREPQPVGERLRALGIAVHELGMAPSRPSLAGLWRLWQVVREFRPDLIQGWMYHGNLAAQLARLAAPRARVLLGVHQTLAQLALESRATRLVIRLDALLSRLAASVLYVAQAAQRDHEAAGYVRRGVLLPNAVDAERFRPDAAARAAVRAQLGLGEDALLVGMVGRFHPAKNHVAFLQAAAWVAEALPQVRFLLAGLAVTPDNPVLAPLLAAPSLQGRVFALGPREDVPQLLAACDLYVLASIQEALPTVVAEAMCCGLPCVVTDVGDAARMVGDTGWVTPLADADALAGEMLLALREGHPALAARGAAARERACAMFAADSVVVGYRQLYQSLAAEAGKSGGNAV